jgi:hypothetical protein
VRSALYYPHTEIRSEALLKTALLLWDKVSVIAPWPGYQPKYSTSSAAEAFDLVGKTHYPSEGQKRKAHELVEDFATRQLPASFMYRSSEGNDRYEVYPQKLLPETWRILQQANLVGQQKLQNSDYAASKSTGLTLMSLLADCCAGETFMRVTDRGAAYASLAGCFVDADSTTHGKEGSVRGRLDELFSNFRSTQARNELVTLSLEVVDANALSLDRLIEFRKEEHKTGGHNFRELRHRLSDSIEDQAKLIMEAQSDEDVAEVKRQFKSKMDDDYESLREGLKLESNQVLGTKEIITTVLAALGTAAAIHAGAALPMHEVVTATGGLVTLGGLFATKSKFARTRQKLLLEHPTAYLYEASGGLRL